MFHYHLTRIVEAIYESRSRVWRQSDPNSAILQLYSLRPAINLSSKTLTIIRESATVMWQKVCNTKAHALHVRGTKRVISYRLDAAVTCTYFLGCCARGRWQCVRARSYSAGSYPERDSREASRALFPASCSPHVSLRARTLCVGVAALTSHGSPSTPTCTFPPPAFNLSYPPATSFQVWQFNCIKGTDNNNSNNNNNNNGH